MIFSQGFCSVETVREGFRNCQESWKRMGNWSDSIFIPADIIMISVVKSVVVPS